MSIQLIRSALVVLTACWMQTLAVPAFAQQSNWAEAMFSEKSHDFGVVARGADLLHSITITNIYKENVHIAGVRTSCGCASATMPTNPTLKTHEKATIDISMDTRRFTRHKDSNVIITFDAPYPAEVWIPVKMYVRTDVVLTPGGVNFGLVDVGQPATQTVDIAYAGRSDWLIGDVRVSNPNVVAQVSEVSRAGGSVNYKLTVQLKPTTPAGSLRSEIQLVTNDAANPTVPVLVEARVEADITISPATVVMGTLVPGQPKSANVVIRGNKPFSISRIECESSDEAFAVRMPEGERAVHVLPLTVTPPNKPGPYSETFTITIPGRPQPVVFKATGNIVNAQAAGTNPG